MTRPEQAAVLCLPFCRRLTLLSLSPRLSPSPALSLSISPPPPHRLKNQRKAVVTAVDKKVPNGILEEQGEVAFFFYPISERKFRFRFLAAEKK